MLIEPFNFDNLRDFGAPEAEQAALDALKAQEALEQEPVEEAPPPPPTYSEAELEQARQASKDRGYEEGVQAGRAQVEGEETERSQHIEAMMRKATESCAQIKATYHGLFQQQCALLSEFVRVTTEKVAGDLLNACPQEALEEVIMQSLPLIIEQPKLQFFVHTELVDPVHKKVLPHLKQRGLGSDVDVVADSSMERSDIRIEWKQGHVQRSTAEIMQAIHGLLSHVDFGAGLREIQEEELAQQIEIRPLELDPKEEDVAAANVKTKEPAPEEASAPEQEGEPEVNMAMETHVDIDEADDGIQVMHASEGETLLSVGEVDDIVDAPNQQPEDALEASSEETQNNETVDTPQTNEEPSAQETKE